MNDNHQGSILGVCVRDIVPHPLTRDECFYWVELGREALEILRLVKIDLVVTTLYVPDMSIWDLIGKIKMAWPWQRWALVCDEFTTQEEIRARTLGVSRMFYTTPDITELYSLTGSVKPRTKEVIVNRSNGETYNGGANDEYNNPSHQTRGKLSALAQR